MSVMTEEEMDYQIELNELYSKTDDIEKSNFNPQMLESCTDTSYQCGYQQGRKDERAATINEVNALIKTRLVDNLALNDATKYGNNSAEQQANSYAAVMKYEIADCVNDLLDDLERLISENDI